MPLTLAALGAAAAGAWGWFVSGRLARGTFRRADATPRPVRTHRAAVVPLATALGALVGLRLPELGPWFGAVALAAVAVAAVLAWVDLDVQRLPDAVVLPCAATLPALLLGCAALEGRWWPLGRALLAGLALLVAFGVLWLLGNGALGLGDVKLAAVLGLLLGWRGWWFVVLGPVLGLLLNALVAAALLAAGRVGRRTPIPLGPALLAGSLAVLAAPSAQLG